MDTQDVEGVLVAAWRTSFDSFPDRRTGEMVPGGESWWLSVCQTFDAAPTKIRVEKEDLPTFEALTEAGQGSKVRLRVQLKAKGSGGGAYLERKLLSVLPVAVPAGRPAQATG